MDAFPSGDAPGVEVDASEPAEEGVDAERIESMNHIISKHKHEGVRQLTLEQRGLT